MTQHIDVRIGRAAYKLKVEPGQEPRLREVSAMFDYYVTKLQDLAQGRIDRDQILVLASLQMADDFYSLKKEQQSQQETLDAFHNSLAERLEKLIK